MKDDATTLRLRHITNVLKNKNKYTEHYKLEKEKNQIFKKMTKEGRWHEYMGITGDFISHTYS